MSSNLWLLDLKELKTIGKYLLYTGLLQARLSIHQTLPTEKDK